MKFKIHDTQIITHSTNNGYKFYTRLNDAYQDLQQDSSIKNIYLKSDDGTDALIPYTYGIDNDLYIDNYIRIVYPSNINTPYSIFWILKSYEHSQWVIQSIFLEDSFIALLKCEV